MRPCQAWHSGPAEPGNGKALTRQRQRMSKSMDEALERLALKAKTLNEKSADVNSVIGRANQKLAEMNLGVTLWLEQFSWPVLLDSARLDDESHHGFQLGYAKVDDAW